MGRQTQVILPDTNSIYTEYNDKGQVTKTYGSQQNPVEYTYDYAGRQKTMTTWQDFNESTGVGISGSAETTWIYDSQRGWLTRKEYDDAEGTDYTYTSAGRLASRTWARGDVTNYAYTSAGDLLAADYSDSATPDIHYTYTRTGQQDVVGEGSYATSPFTAGAIFTPSFAPALNTTDRSATYAYNARFQVDTETTSGLLSSDAVLTRTYQDGTETNGLDGRAEGYDLSIAGGTSSVSSATYAYDTAGRLGSVTDGTDTFTYGYTANTTNLLASMTGPVHTTTYSYESGRNAMTGIQNEETVGTNSVVSNYAYSYNALGQRADREQSGTAFSSTTKDTFTYDYLGQVTASANDTTTGNAYNPTYAYDEIGNRTGNTVDLSGTTGYTQDLLNQYTAVGANSPTYDDDGNLTSDGTNSYTWNGENRLLTGGGATFTYDYQGRLIEKNDGTDVEVYLYDGWNRIAKYVNGTLDSTNLWGLDLSGSMQGAGGVGGLLKEGSLYPTYDANGNIVQKLNSSGVATMKVEYDPFGNVIAGYGTWTGEYGFSTKPFVDGPDWYYYGFRYYDPGTGRWPSRDPLQEGGGNNLYRFTWNNPLNWIDVLGGIPLAPGGNIEQPERPDPYKCVGGQHCYKSRGVDLADLGNLSFSQFGTYSGSVSWILASGIYLELGASVSFEHGKCCDENNNVKEYNKLSGSVSLDVVGSTSIQIGGSFGFSAGGKISGLGDCPSEGGDFEGTVSVSASASAGIGGVGSAGCSNNYSFSDKSWSGWSCSASWSFQSSLPGVKLKGGGSLQGTWVDIF
jgi:RHS repeat-associated protein